MRATLRDRQEAWAQVFGGTARCEGGEPRVERAQLGGTCRKVVQLGSQHDLRTVGKGEPRTPTEQGSVLKRPPVVAE